MKQLIETENTDREPVPDEVINRLMRDFFQSKSRKTMEAYQRDLEQFTEWMNAEGIGQAIDQLIQGGAGRANMIALEYKNDLKHDRDLAPSTINRRLAALRSITKLARRFGFINWSISIENLSTEKYRDTRGPGPEGFEKMLQQAKTRDDAKGKRDVALLRILHDLALRRHEAIGIDLEDVDLTMSEVRIETKGRESKQLLSMPDVTTRSLDQWIQVRGEEPGPVFTNFDRSSVKENQRLSGTAVYQITKKYGEQAGVERSHPHGLRHLAVTKSLRLTDGNLRAVQQFSRHQSIGNLKAYDDNWADLQGEVAKQVAEA